MPISSYSVYLHLLLPFLPRPCYFLPSLPSANYFLYPSGAITGTLCYFNLVLVVACLILAYALSWHKLSLRNSHEWFLVVIDAFVESIAEFFAFLNVLLLRHIELMVVNNRNHFLQYWSDFALYVRIARHIHFAYVYHFLERMPSVSQKARPLWSRWARTFPAFAEYCWR